jgi:hypothetical protein
MSLFSQILDIVLEDEKVRFAAAGEADEGLVVILNDADDLLVILHLHADGRGIFDQALEVFGLFKCLFRRASGLSTLL